MLVKPILISNDNYKHFFHDFIIGSYGKTIFKTQMPIRRKFLRARTGKKEVLISWKSWNITGYYLA